MLTLNQYRHQKKQSQKAEQRLGYLLKQSLLLHKSNSDIARELGLTRQRVDQLVGDSYNPEQLAKKRLESDLEFVRFRVYVDRAIDLDDVADFYGLSIHTVRQIVGGRKTSLDALGLRVCYRCNAVKLPDDFGKYRNGLATTCKPCASKNSRQHYRQRKEQLGLRARETQALPTHG